MPAQLALNLRLRDGSSLDNFYAGANRELLERLRRLLVGRASSGPSTLFIAGETASGKSHLLQAACRLTQSEGQIPLYIPLSEPGIDPSLLDAAEEAFLVCLDDVQHIAGDITWERALFALYELMRAREARLIAAANAVPMQLGLVMPELATRFAWGSVYQLQPLTDDEKIEAVRLRARNRGLDIPVDVARYILSRYPRDLNSLFTLLERIDAVSLAKQRRITIPFLREMMERDAT